ncbi:hypothetical protein F5Y10DRAFT_243707 [Nemania abortiva]|nr:hypothetical protein F5Y10DRAFT_243707 [Nemania abortiva]
MSPSTVNNTPLNANAATGTSPSTVNNTPLNANAATGTRIPVDQAAKSSRCARKDCNNWSLANSRFCKDR